MDRARSRALVAAPVVAAVAAMTHPAALADTPSTLEHRAPARSASRVGELPLGAVIRTDERYGGDGLLQGPRGWDYWNRLENPRDYQNPNLWGDKRPTYFMGQLEMPQGTTLTLRGRFPHARYFKVALYRFERNTFVALDGEDLAGWEIEPDSGSANPYVVGADRTVEQRSYTVHVIGEERPVAPAARAANTLYAGGAGRPIQIIYRIYVSDEGFDGAGIGLADAPAPDASLVAYEATLADGTRLSGDEVVERLSRPLGSPSTLMGVDQWYARIESESNDPALSPATAPARPESRWEIFRGVEYNVSGAFLSPEERAKIELQTEMEGGGDPTTVYMINYLSRQFGPVYVFRAKLPTFPDTYAGASTMGTGQVIYWSVVTAASAPSGELWDGLFDMMLPLDEEGFYTIVVSRPEDRPANATRENGVAWIDWGPGEGLDDPRNRGDWGMLLMRFMVCDPDWANSPAKALEPGTEDAVMGPYHPHGYYTTRDAFEAAGTNPGAEQDR